MMDHYRQLLEHTCSGLIHLGFLVPLGILFIYLNNRSGKVFNGITLLGIFVIVFLSITAQDTALSLIAYYGGDRVGQDLMNGCANIVLFVTTLAGFFLLHMLLTFLINKREQKISHSPVQDKPVQEKSIKHTDPYTQKNLRSGALHYLMGRGAAGMAGFLTILLLVRFMDVSNYAAYTSLSGIVSICGVLAGLGMERIISRYVPEGRLYRSVDELSRFIWSVSIIRLVAVLLIVLLLYVLWPEVNRFLVVTEFKFFSTALMCLIVSEMMFEHFSAVLQSLVMQKVLTRLMIIQWAGRLLLIGGIVAMKSRLDWEDALWIFAIPEMLGVIGFVIVINLHLRSLSDPEQIKSAGGSWPVWRRVTEVGLHNYGFALLAAPPQGYFMKILSAAYLTEEVVAAYGFCISLAEKARQYIPLHFFYGMLEPMMIAGYLKDRNFSELSYRCQLLYKSNLLLMVPMIAWVAVAGDAIVGLLTGGKFQGLSWILVLVMTQLTIGSHVVLLQLILNSLGKSRLLISASLVALPVMMIPLTIALATNPMYLLCTPLSFSISMNLFIVFHLARSNLIYKPSWQMLWSIILSGLASFLLTLSIASQAQSLQPGAVAMAVASLAAVIMVYVVALRLMKVIRRSEILLVKSLITGH